jgi:Tol biopolymer transport system component
MPIVSAVAVLILGFALTYGAIGRFQSQAADSIAGAGTTSATDAPEFDLEHARIMYLQKSEAGQFQVVIADTNGKLQRTVTEVAEGTGVVGFELSPDGSRIIYVVQAGDLKGALWLVNVDGSQKREVLSCSSAICSQPVWSPDGTRVAFESLDMSGNGVVTGLPSLWWLDIETGQTRPIFQDSQLPGSNPRWSPDGEWLAYSTPDGLRLYRLSTGESRTIKTVLPGAAKWAPDGQSIMFRDVLIRNDQYVTQIFVYGLATGEVTNLNEDTGFENLLAAWSPDGSKIAVIRRDLSVDRGDQLWLISADGRDARQITDVPAALHGTLSWSPDGAYLLYDIYEFDSASQEWRLEVVEVESGKIIDLGLQGYTPQWVIGN